MTHLLDCIAQEITQRGFTIPNGLLNNVRIDKMNNTANRWRLYEQETSNIPTPTITPPTL